MKKSVFKKGQKVKYIGNRKVESASKGEEMKPQIFNGMIAVITEVRPPQKGLGRFHFPDGEEGFDYDSDGYAIYMNEFGRGAIINNEDKKDWIILEN